MRTYVNVALFENGKKGNSFTDEIVNISSDMFCDWQPGDKYLITFVEMEEKDFEALPDFEGF
jgi:hypothetical protein